MALLSEDYLDEATENLAASERCASMGDIRRAKQLRIDAVLDFLRYSVRRVDGPTALLKTPVHECVRQAATADGKVHPTHLLDAAHVALLFGEHAIARKWLTQAASEEAWSRFWVHYSASLLDLLEGRKLEMDPVVVEYEEQRGWTPYIELMRALSIGANTNSLSEAIRHAFRERQCTSTDPGLLDGRPDDPILWDWRYDAILLGHSRETLAGRFGTDS